MRVHRESGHLWLRSEGHARVRLPTSFQLVGQQAWFWRVVPEEQKTQERPPELGGNGEVWQKRVEPPTIVSTTPQMPREDEDEGQPTLTLDAKGWAGRLRFVDVPNLAMRYPYKGRRKEHIRDDRMIDEIP